MHPCTLCAHALYAHVAVPTPIPPLHAPMQERLRALMDQRKALVDEGWAPVGAPKDGLRREESRKEAGSAMVEKERQHLEVNICLGVCFSVSEVRPF